MRNLTQRQRAVYEALVDLDQKGDPPPSLDQLCQILGLSSRGSLHKHIQALIDAGLVSPMEGRHRGVCLVNSAHQDNSLTEAPLLGRIAAGVPLEAVADAQSTELPSYLHAGPNCYVLEVDGDSMRDEGILDGDLVVVAGDQHGRHGDIVVALVDGSEVTLKRLAYAHDMVQLIPANPNFDTLILAPERVQIQGVVVGQMRRYQ